jgi:hypothetical protein
MDSSCFKYGIKKDDNGNIKYDKDGNIIEYCKADINCKDCINCPFYQQPHMYEYKKALAEIRNQKLKTGKLRCKYSLEINGNKEGTFESIEAIDEWLKKSKYSKDDESELEIEEIYTFNVIKIRKEDV